MEKRNIRLMICYVSKDKEIASKIAELLEKQTFDCNLEVVYMDKEGVGCANDWEVWSEKNVKSSDIIMQVWTNNTMESVIQDEDKKINSKIIRDELGLARDWSKQIVILDFVGPQNYAEGYDIASKTISKTYLGCTNIDVVSDIIISQVKDRIYKISNDIKPDYYFKQKVIKSNDALGGIGDKFVGREKELCELDNLFSNDKKIVFLSGDGGIGKTEIARRYAQTHTDNNLCCIKICTDDHNVKLSDVILSLDYENGFTEEEEKKTEKEKALIRINQLRDVDARFILIIDNFNANLDETDNKELFNKLAESVNFKVLLSSRSKCNNNNPKIGSLYIDVLKEEDQLELFYERCNEDDVNLEKCKENDEKILELSNIIQGHTLTLELCARIINKRGLSIDEVKNSLFTNTTKVESERFASRMSIYNHLLKVFELADLSDSQKDILYLLSFISTQRGISYKDMNNIIEVSEDDFDYLCDISLIKKRDKAKYYLHSLVSDLSFNEFKDGRNEIYQNVCDYLLNITDCCYTESSTITEEKREYLAFLCSRSVKLYDNERNEQIYLQLGNIEVGLYNIESAIYNYKKSLEIAEFGEDKEIIYHIYCALFYIDESNFNNYYTKALNLLNDNNWLKDNKEKVKLKIDLYFQASVVYGKQRDYKEQLQLLLKANRLYLDEFADFKGDVEIVLLHDQISYALCSLYKNNDFVKESILNAYAALKELETIDDNDERKKYRLMHWYSFLGTYEGMGSFLKKSYELAISLQEEARALWQKENLITTFVSVGLINNCFGENYKKRIDSLLIALKLANEMYEISNNVRILEDYMDIYYGLGKNYFYTRDYANAKDYFIKSLELAESNSFSNNAFMSVVDIVSDIYNCLRIIYHRCGEFDKEKYYSNKIESYLNKEIKPN